MESVELFTPPSQDSSTYASTSGSASQSLQFESLPRTLLSPPPTKKRGRPKSTPSPGRLPKRKRGRPMETKRKQPSHTAPNPNCSPIIIFRNQDEEQEDQVATQNEATASTSTAILDEGEIQVETEITSIPVTILSDVRKSMLGWWVSTRQQKMLTCRNNGEKSAIWEEAVEQISCELNVRISRHAVKSNFHSLKAAYKKAIQNNNTSGAAPSTFEFLQECALAFENDLDIHPAQGILQLRVANKLANKISDQRQTPAMPKRARRRVLPGREQEQEDREEQRQFRGKMLDLLEQLINKFSSFLHLLHCKTAVECQNRSFLL